MTLLFALTMACGEKEDTSTAAPEEAATPASSAVPDDKASKAFAKRLFELDIKRFQPVEGDGIKLEYDSFVFKPDGNWVATGTVSVMDESMDCKERGVWTMDAADSEETASMTWTLEDTSCPGREPHAEQRVEVTILDDGQFKVKFR
ncbi:MAG TPA: hypothetical protein QGF58_13735 [Myxococcota bacterium]|nr:hypothetical protein [Myxococcota bacterium]